MSQKWYKMELCLQWQTDRKLYVIYQMVPFFNILAWPQPRFQGRAIIQHWISQEAIRDRHMVTSPSRMRVMNHNWSAMKQRLHPQSVAEISRHLVLSGDRIQQCGTSSGSHHKNTDQCKSPFPSADTAVSLFHAKTVQQRSLLPKEVETWLPDCEVAH